MSVFWGEMFGGLASAVALTAIGLLLSRPMARWMLGPILTRFVKDRYTENLFGAVTVLRHVGPQVFGETLMRTTGPEPISRPLGSPLQMSPWDQLLLQPVYLTPRLPTPESIEIDTHVVIGPHAEQPLSVDVPLVVTAMSYGGALSVAAKLALAKGANLVGTATNTGESYLPEERATATRLIVQHCRGLWPKSSMRQPDILRQADAIEIQLGQGAQAAAAMMTPAAQVHARMGDVYGLEKGQAERLATRFDGVDSARDFIRMVRQIKDSVPVPVGVKVGAGAYLERELDIFLEAGIDFVTVDGAEGGTHGSPPTLQDDVGIPALYALSRADRYLRRVGARDRVTLIVAGQMTSPGRFVKAMALGADAVYLGSVALIAILGEQMKKTLPWEPPTDLVMQASKKRWRKALDPDESAVRLANYMRSCTAELCYVAQSLGYRKLSEIGLEDMCALSGEVARAVGVRTVWEEPEDDFHEHGQARGRRASRTKGQGEERTVLPWTLSGPRAPQEATES